MHFSFRHLRKHRKKAVCQPEEIQQKLDNKSLVLVGLMGAGKTAIGKRLANQLDLPFVDADTEIEIAAGKSIEDIFAEHGEAHFRQGEHRVIIRLLKEGPQILATGGGAFMHPETRQHILDHDISIWLKADLDVLMERVSRRSNRPLLQTDDPKAVMQKLIEERYPIYEQANIAVQSRNVPHDVMVSEIINELAHFLKMRPSKQ